jgi:hypothetical protein
LGEAARAAQQNGEMGGNPERLREMGNEMRDD